MLAIAILFLVSAQSLHSTHAAVAKHPVEEMPIMYPEPIENKPKEKVTHENMVEEVPEACKDLTYCTIKPKNYPEEKFNEMLKGYKPMIPQPTLVLDITFDNRQGELDNGDGCSSEVTYQALYQVREKRDQPWRTVVNAPERDYIQKVRLEKCTEPDAKCFTVFSQVPEFVTYCKQKWNVWEVLVSKGNNETELIKAELPVCCSCHYKPVDFVTRFGKHRK